MKRLPTWQGALDALVAERMRRPFEWGVHDCVTFAADAVLAMTGVDLAEPWRGSWSTARGAFRTLQPLGGLKGALRGLDLPEVGPRRARRGDLVLLQPPARAGSMRGALGVCLGERVAAPGIHGLVLATLGQEAAAWRI